MANLKEIRGRITSVHSTRQITSAMKMVSAAKLRRAQDAIIQMRPYALKLQDILSNLSGSLDSSEGVYSQDRDPKNVLIVAITSNRGLCGAFNNNVIKNTLKLGREFQSKGSNVSVLSIGKKAADFFKGTDLNIKASDFPKHMNEIFDNLTFQATSEIAENIMRHFADKGIDRVYLVYNRFKNAAMQELMTEQFLPVLPPENASEKTTQTDYIFEPTRSEIVQQLIPKSLKTQLFKALLDSHASEHGARMTAMHKATDNASELLKDLRLTYNKARQAAITNEILEITGGAEALKG